MGKNTRREFIAKLGLTVGALTVGRKVVQSSPSDKYHDSIAGLSDEITDSLAASIDFRYAPANWQSTYCYPDDPFKSLVGKNGELLYGHPGIGADEKIFPHVVSVGISGKEQLGYLEQKIESPSVPVITTDLESDELTIRLISYATNEPDEGRVDNLFIEIGAKGSEAVRCVPEIIVKSENMLIVKNENGNASVRFDSGEKKLFFTVDSPAEYRSVQNIHHYLLKEGSAAQGNPLRYFARFPQEGQSAEIIADGLKRHSKLIEKTRLFWRSWQPTAGRVKWELMPEYGNFAIASARNILEAREVKEGRKLFQVGSTVYRGLWVVDGHFILEAARYLGYDKEAQEGLESIWNRQDKNGLITAGAGEAHWKDTAVAVFALIRQAELSQNWDYFNELYPDAHKAIMALKDMRDRAKGDGSSNGKYKLLPRGFGDSGIGGVREEFTNTIWTLTALRAFDDVLKRFSMTGRIQVRDFYGELRQDFYNAKKEELRHHPNGFSYLPMLMKSDPKWNETDPVKRPKPQAAQIYLSHAIYPGLLFKRNDELVTGHTNLMNSIIKEDIPSETGWMSHDALWPYNAPIAAQVFLWLSMPERAHDLFIGFLNHASPLLAWREEQTLRGSDSFNYIGDMPHNWASAECIRYLRHMMILEDETQLRLFEGITMHELGSGKKMELTYSPTRWGRVTLSLEPADNKTWYTKFKREDFNESKNPPLDYIIMPRKLAKTFYFNGAKGVVATKNADEVLVRVDSASWECEWKAI